MKNFLIVLILFASSLIPALAAEPPLYIRLDFEILELVETEHKDYGIEKSQLQEIVTKQLAASNIIVKGDPNLPHLLFRIKSIPTDGVIATYVQTSFFEEAKLLHSKKNIWATTWLQTGLMVNPKENYVQTVTKEALNNVNSFILDYRKEVS